MPCASGCGAHLMRGSILMLGSVKSNSEVTMHMWTFDDFVKGLVPVLLAFLVWIALRVVKKGDAALKKQEAHADNLLLLNLNFGKMSEHMTEIAGQIKTFIGLIANTEKAAKERTDLVAGALTQKLVLLEQKQDTDHVELEKIRLWRHNKSEGNQEQRESGHAALLEKIAEMKIELAEAKARALLQNPAKLKKKDPEDDPSYVHKDS